MSKFKFPNWLIISLSTSLDGEKAISTTWELGFFSNVGLIVLVNRDKVLPEISVLDWILILSLTFLLAALGVLTIS